MVGLKEKAMSLMQEAKAEMTEAWKTLEAQVGVITAFRDACARPHRCWPSRAGWGLAGLLAAYVCFLHSFWANERQTWEQRTLSANQAFITQTIAAYTTELEQISAAYQQMQQERAAWFAPRSSASSPRAHWWSRPAQ